MAMDAVMLAAPPVRRAALVPEDAPRKPKRLRVRSRFGRAVLGSRKARLEFLGHLARSGDPALAADAMGLNLLLLFRLRAADADFAADWHAAIGFAWERVENNVLAKLLKQAEAPGEIDSKLVLAILARRDAGKARVQGRKADSAAVARFRAELRALAGPDTVPGK